MSVVKAEEIRLENENLIKEINSLRENIAHNKKDSIYLVGELVYNNRTPIYKMFTLPFKIHKALKEYTPIQGDMDVSIYEGMECDEMNKALQEERDRLMKFRKLNNKDGKYLIGREIVVTGRSFTRMLSLPWRLLKAYKKLNKLNSYQAPSSGFKMSKIQEIGDTILFVATNGAGLGHLTRCISVARRLKKMCPDKEIIFLTTSLALTIVNREGFLAYCVPSKELIKNIEPRQWNWLMKNQLSEILSLYNVKTIIFDGATPYASVTAAIAQNNMHKVWIKRGGEKDEIIAAQRKEMEKPFDTIIIPGEAGSVIPNDDEKHVYVNPILHLDREELWSREDVRKYLKIPEGKKVAYIQLGAGNINDINSDINHIVTEIRKHEDVIMVLGESLIGNELKIIEDDIIIVKDYPNSKYFNGFDFAVSACGYNTFHELVFFGVPTLFLPNMNTKTDDQYGRAMKVQNVNGGVVLTDFSELPAAIDMLCDDNTNSKMRENLKSLMEVNGAGEVANAISKYV